MGRDTLQRLWDGLASLGARRLVALAMVGIAVVSLLSVSALYLTKPQREVLYSGLSRDDVGRIGAALGDAGFDFDVSADGATVNVNYGQAARARMRLAEKGLPQSADAGYEIFNQVGSFGLTSFMQDVTKTRALEGELARSIQSMSGIKSARVHLVLPDRGSFRSDQQSASASVVISSTFSSDSTPTQAIRHLVAAAVPGLKVDQVSVLSTDGTVLASSDSAESASAGHMASVEQQLNQDIEAKVRRTLAPYLGIGNFQVSVVSRVNLDKTTTSEVIYDPASRVERSVRTVRENALAQNSTASSAAATVQQNIPNAQGLADTGKNSNETNDRREELTNYEVSSRTIETAHDGFKIESLSIAVLLNQAKLEEAAGKGPDALPVEHQLMEIEQLVAAAAGLNRDRGDQLKVGAAAFVDNTPPEIADPGIVSTLMEQFGAIFNGLALIVVAIVAILFGLRPAINAIIVGAPEQELAPGSAHTLMDLNTESAPVLAAQSNGSAGGVAATSSSHTRAQDVTVQPPGVNLIEDVTQRMNRSPQKRLEQIVEYDEAQAAAILRQWLRQDEATA